MTFSAHAGAGEELSLSEALGISLPAIEICDVGAMNEGVERYAKLVAQGIANVTGFEADSEQCASLQAMAKPRHRYLPVCLGDGGPAIFHVARYRGCSSIYEADPAILDRFSAIGTGPGGNFKIVSTHPVSTTRLDDVSGLPEIDFLKLDVQGAELDVLRGADKALASAVVIEVEVEFIPLYKNQPLFGDIDVFLRQRGFLLHKFVDIAGRPLRPFHGPGKNPCAPLSQVLWADAIYVRDFTRLDWFTDERLLRCAAILSAAYDSHDMVYYLLSAYDQRRGTSTAERYRQATMSNPRTKLQYMTLRTE